MIKGGKTESCPPLAHFSPRAPFRGLLYAAQLMTLLFPRHSRKPIEISGVSH